MDLPQEEEFQSDHSFQMDEREGDTSVDNGEVLGEREMVNGGHDMEDGMEFDEGEDDEEFQSSALEDDLGEEEEEESDMVISNEYGAPDPEEDEDDGDDEIPDQVDTEADRYPNFNSYSNEEDWNEDDAEEYLDYSCQVCGLSMIHLKDLFTHLESHDADEYAFSTTDKSELAEVCYGDSCEASSSGGRKWPSRFLKFPSPVFLTLSQFQNVQENGIHKSDSGSGSEGEGKQNGGSDSIFPKFRNRLMRPARIVQNGVSGKLAFQRRRYTCPHCPKEFQRPDHFRQHLLNHQQGDSKPFACKICGERFSVIVTLRRHMATHPDYKPFECSRCPRRFHDFELLKVHEESPYTHTETEVNGQVNPKVNFRRKCRVCFQTFGTEVTRAEHERRVHGHGLPKPILRCRYTSCRAVQPTLKLLIQHYREKHGADKLLAEARKDKSKLSNGKEVPTAQAQLTIPKDSNSPTMVNNGSQPSPAGVKGTEECRMCFSFLVSIPERNHHEQTVHNINHPGTVLQCKYPNCRKILGAKNWLARHIREHRQRINNGMDSDPQLSVLNSASRDDRIHMEEERDEISEPQQQQYPDDSSEGESEEIWDCRLCDERFESRGEREAHEEHVHDTGNPRSEFLCKYCLREMGNFTCLLFHLDKSHRNQPGGAQQLLSPSPSSLPPGPAAATPPKPKTKLIFPCRHCDLIYSDQHVRINHEYEVHDTRDALDNYYPCKVCGKVMTLRGLRKHLRKIHGHQPHVEVNESDEQNPFPPQSLTPKLPLQPQNSTGGNATAAAKSGHKTPQPPKPVYKRTSEPSTAAWVCRLCFQHFDEQRQRETHEHSVHGTNAPNATFVCKYSKCELEFGTFRALIKHLREHGETTLPTGQQRLPVSSLTQYKPGQTAGSSVTPESVGSPSGQALVRNDSKDSLLWKCRLCWEVFPSQQHRLTHEINSHQTNHPSKSLLCKYCPKQFSIMRQLVKHLESHGEGKMKGQTTTMTSGISISRGEEEEEDFGPPKLEPQVPQHATP